MSDEPTFTYYARLWPDGGLHGLLRRAPGRRDEIFARDATWQLGEWLRKYELGHNDFDFREVPSDEAEALIQRWTKKWAEEDSGTGSNCAKDKT